MRDVAEIFATNRYVVLPSLLKQPDLDLFYRYARTLAGTGAMKGGDPQVPGTPSIHGDFMMEGLLADLLPAVAGASRADLFPTYAYFRVYKRGDVLRRHTDRPACEISVTLCLGYDADGPWPIWIEGPCGIASVALEPGDALLYRGIECPHWRETFAGESAAQVFLHYVEQHGPHRDHRFDGRDTLTTFPVSRRLRSDPPSG
jgi:hypothetical protein